MKNVSVSSFVESSSATLQSYDSERMLKHNSEVSVFMLEYINVNAVFID